MTKIVAFSGSSRAGSFNQKMLNIAVQGAEEAGASVTLVSLKDYPMPLFNEDEESANGMPDGAIAFKELLCGSDGFLIASPEYNSAFTPLLKNALDWASRPSPKDKPGVSPFRGKSAAIMAASPGALGGMRGLVFLRMLLGNLGVLVSPDQQTLPVAHEAFSEDGAILDMRKHKSVKALGAVLYGLCQK